MVSKTPYEMFRNQQEMRKTYVKQTVEECSAAKLLYINNQLALARSAMYKFMDLKYEEPRA